VKTLYLLMGLAAMTAMGCSDDDVGSPCAPSRPQGQRCDVNSGAGDGGTAGCFQGSEVYIETQSLQCRSRICLVYRFAESTSSTPRPGRLPESQERVYCTCRCGVPDSLRSTTDPSVLCQCPTGFTCVTNLAGEQYSEGVRGSYCVRSSTLGM
jgi:hypothetical protein